MKHFVSGLLLALVCDANLDGVVTIDELVQGIKNALVPCDCRACPPDECVEVAVTENGHTHMTSMCINDVPRCGGE